MTLSRSILCLFVATITGCTRAIVPGDPPRAPAHEDVSEIDLDASTDDAAGDAGAIHLPDACAPDEPAVTVRARFATYMTRTTANITDATFTGPRSSARVRCAAFLAASARDRAASGGTTVHARVLRRCDERPLPPVVRGSRTRVELLRESSSGAGDDVGSALFLVGAPRSCIESPVAITRTDRTPFETLEACETIHARLEASDRDAAASGRRDGLAWLDDQIAKIDDDVRKARVELAAYVARSAADAHEKRDRMEGEMSRMNRERLEANVQNRERLGAMIRERRDQEAKKATVVDVKGTCVRVLSLTAPSSCPTEAGSLRSSRP